MMDFNLILLFVGLGLLGIVILFALWGFLGGLKRELSCIAVFIILLVLAWLVFGNSGVLLNYSGGIVGSLREMLGLQVKDATVWETILDYLKSMEGLNLGALLVEGKETYNLVYSIASGVATLVLLIVSTLVVVIVTPIIRLISHIVLLIIASVKKRKAKKAGIVEEEKVESKDETADDAVLVLKGVDGAGDAVVTLSENELPDPKKTKKRVLGALAGALKGVFLIILLFAPISGIYAVLRTATPETRELISNLVDGNTNQQTVAESQGPTDLAFDFVDSYGESGIGKFVEGSSYFFGQSFSTLLFDSMANIKTTRQTIKLREELIVFIEAVNALDGSAELGTWSQAEVNQALETLKKSKLIPEIMPAAIEFAGEMEMVKPHLDKAMQTTAFLSLRDINWDKDIETILDAVKSFYKLGLFPLEELNVLTLDAEVLKEAVGILGDTQFVNKVFPVAIRTLIKMEAVEKLTGFFGQKMDLEAISWKNELLSIVEIYDKFQSYGYNDLEQITSAQTDALVNNVIVDHFGVTTSIVETLLKTKTFQVVLVPVMQAALDTFFATEENGFGDFAHIINLKELDENAWLEDFNSILSIAKLAVSELNAMSLDLNQMDISSDKAVDAMKEIIEKVFTLNILGDDETKNNLIVAAFKKFELFNEEDLYIVSSDGSEKHSILKNVNWESTTGNIGEIEVLQRVLDVYKKFIQLEGVSMSPLSVDFMAILETEEGVDVLVEVLEELIESELVISLISPATNKYVLPLTDKFDDDNVVSDILNGMADKKEIAEEIIKIVKAIKDAQTLGLFDVAKDGLQALKYEETEAIKNIIDAILGTKLLEGVEGRVIRIILKATNILDVDKETMTSIDFSGEKDKLITFIDKVEPILKDPAFKLVNEEGLVVIDLEYLMQPEIFAHLSDAVQYIFGTFTRDENGEFVETEGSNLVVALLPSIMDKFVLPAVPAEFKELVEILDLANIEGEALARDLKRIMYVAGQLVEMDAQTLLIGGEIVYTEKLQNIYNIVDVLLDVDMFKPCGNEVFAWVFNYAADKFATQFNLEKVTAEDFATIDWKVEGANIKAVITEIIEFLQVNKLESTKDVLDFINNKEYEYTSFVTTQNVNRIFGILDKLLELDILECLIPVVFQAGVNLLTTNNVIEKDFWNKSLTGSQLIQDLQSIRTIADVLVNEMEIVELWRANFNTANFDIPASTSINKVLDGLFALNLVKGFEADLFNFALTKFLPANELLKVEDFGLENITSWDAEVKALEDVIAEVINLIHENGLTKVGEVMDEVKLLTMQNAINKYLTTENATHILTIVEKLTNLQIVKNILVVAFERVVDKQVEANVLPENFWKGKITADDLIEDIKAVKPIATVLFEETDLIALVKANFDITNFTIPQSTTINKVLDQVFALNLIEGFETDLVDFAITKFLPANEFVKPADFALSTVDWKEEVKALEGVIAAVLDLIQANAFVKVGEVMDLVKTSTMDDFIQNYLNSRNVNYVLTILEKATDLQMLENVLVVAFERVVDKQVEANVLPENFWKGNITSAELIEDIKAVKPVVNVLFEETDLIALVKAGFNLVDFTIPASSTINKVLDQVFALNLIEGFEKDLVDFALTKFLPANEIVKPADFDLSTVDWKEEVKALENVIAKVLETIDANGFTKAGYLVDEIKYNKLDEAMQKYLTDANIVYIAEIIALVADLQMVENIMPAVLNFGLQKASQAGYNVDFLNDVTKQELTSDVKVVAEIVKILAAEGVADIVNKVANAIDKKELTGLLDTAKQIVGKLNELNLITKHENELMSVLFNKAFELAKLTDFTLTAEDLANVDWNADFESIQEVITLVQKLAQTNNLVNVKNAKDYLNDVKADIKLVITESNVNIVLEIVREVATTGTLKALLPQVINYASKLAADAGINLSFIKDTDLTNEQLANDIVTLTYIISDVIELDAISIYKGEKVSEFDAVKVESLVQHLSELNILAHYASSWMKTIVNYGLDKLNISGYNYRYIESDFNQSHAAWKEDTASLASALVALTNVLEELFSDGFTINAVKDFIANKEFTQKANLTDTVVDNIAKALSDILNINVISFIVRDVVEFGLDKVKAAGTDITFIKESATSKNLSQDMLVIGEIVKLAIDFGAIDYYHDKNIEKVDTSYLAQIVGLVDTLNIFKLNRAEIMAFAFNKVFAMAKLDITVEAEDFGYMTEAMWQHDNAQLQTVINLLQNLFIPENNLISTNDVLAVVKENKLADQNYIFDVLVTDANIDTIAMIVHELFKIETLTAVEQDLVNFGVDKVANIEMVKGLDVEFIKEALNKEVISHDILNIAEIIKTAINFGAVQYVKEQEIENVELTKLNNVFTQLNEMMLFANAREGWMNLIANAATKFANISITYTEKDFAPITDEMANDATASVHEVLAKLDNILNIWELDDLSEIINFIKGSGYMMQANLTEEVAKELVSIVSTIVNINPVKSLLPKALVYGIVNFEDKVDLNFMSADILGGLISKDVLAEDVQTILSVVNDAIDLGAISILYKLHETEPFEIKYDYIISIARKVASLNLLEAYYSEWAALVVEQVAKLVKAEGNISADDFAYMSDRKWKQDVTSVIDILEQVVTLLEENNLNYYDEIMNFISSKGYTHSQYVTDDNVYAVLDIVDTVASMNASPILLRKVMSYGFKQFVLTNDNLSDLAFIYDAIKEQKYTATNIQADLLTITSIARDALEFGLVEVLFDNTISNINVAPIHSIIMKFAELELFHISEATFAELLFEQVFKMMNLDAKDYSVKAVEYETMTREDWNAEFAKLAQIVDMVGELLANNEITSSTELISFIEAKAFMSAHYVTDENVYAVIDIVDAIAQLELLVPALDEFAKYGIGMFQSADLDIDFIVRTIKDGELTARMIQEDILTVLSIAKDAISFGAVELMYYGTLDVIDFEIVKNVITKVASLNIIQVDKREWTAFVANKALSMLKVGATVTTADFAAITDKDWSDAYKAVIKVIGDIEQLLIDNHIENCDELVSFVKDQNYKLAQYATEENVKDVLAIVQDLATLKLVEPVMTHLVKFGLSKVPTTLADVSFLTDAIGVTLMGDALQNDVVTIISIVHDLLDFGALEYVFYKELTTIDLSYVTSVITKLNELNMYKVAKVDWAVLVVNKVYEALKVGKTVTAADFAHIDMDHELEQLIKVVDHVDELLRALNIETTTQLKDFIRNKDYIKGNYVTDETVAIVANLAEDLIQMQIFKVMLPDLVNFALGKVNSSDLAFLKDAINNKEITGEDLVNDIMTVIGILRKAITLGAFDYIYNIEVAEINGDILADIFADVTSMNVYAKLRAQWISLGLNKVLKGLNITVSASEFAGIDEAMWQEDNQAMQNAIKAIADLLEELELTYLSKLKGFISNKDYLAKEMLSDTNIELFDTILTNVIGTHVVDVIFDEVLGFVVSKAQAAGFDISFVENKYHAMNLVHDVPAILNIAKNVLDFGIEEFVKEKEISNINVDYLVNVVKELENMDLVTMFRANWIETVGNKVLAKVNEFNSLDYSVLPTDEALWKQDNVTLQNLIKKFGEILDNNNLQSYSDVKAFVISDKKLTLEETYTDENITLFADAFKLVFSFNVFDKLFPQVMSVAVSYANKAKLDISYLETTLTIEMLKHDVDVITQMFKPAAKFGLFEFVATKEIHLINLEYLNPIIALIPSLEIFNISPANFAAAVINCISENAKLGLQKVLPTDFASVDWDAENELFRAFVTEVDKVLIETDLVALSNIKELIDNKFKPHDQYVNAEIANYVVDALAALVNLQTVEAISETLVNAILNKVIRAGYDFTFLTANVNNAEVYEDIHSLIAAVRDLINFGIVDVIKGEEVNYANKADLYSAIQKVLNLHMLEGNGNNVVVTVFTKLGIDTSLLNGGFEFSSEYNTITTILDNLIVILDNYGLYKLSAIKGFKVKGLVAHSDQNIDAVANIIETLQSDDLFNYVIMAVSSKYLANAKYAGVMDIHNIYPSLVEFNSDLASLVEVLRAVSSLHIYDFMTGAIDYPINEKVPVQTIINKLFNLNYFNLPGRMENFVQGLGNITNSVSLANIDASSLDLPHDAAKLIEMHDYLVAVFGQDSFPIKNKQDVDSKVKVPLSFFTKEANLNRLVDAVKAYMDTTIYDQTGAAVLLVVVPLLKNVLNEYWVALDLDNYKVEQIVSDTPHFQAILETIMSLDLVDVVNGQIEFAGLDDKINTIIQAIDDLELFNGHMNAFVQLLVRDLVYGKKIAGTVVPSGAFDIANVDFENDLAVLRQIVTDLFDLLDNEAITSLSVVNSYINAFLIDRFVGNNSLVYLANLYESILELTMVQNNIKQVYEIFLVPVLEKVNKLEYADYTKATNEEMMNDLTSVLEIIRIAIDVDIKGILNNNVIDYVGVSGTNSHKPTQMVRLAEILAKSNYAKYHLDTYLAKLATTIEGIYSLSASYDSLDVEGDFNKIALAYAKLAEILNASDSPLKTMEDYKAISTKKLLTLVKENLSEVSEVYEILVQASIAPYFVPTLIDALEKALPAGYKDVVSPINVYGYTLEALHADMIYTATIVKHLIDANVIELILTGKAELPSHEAVCALVDDIFAMNIFKDNINAMFENAMKATKLDVTGINFAAINLEQDKEEIKNAICDLVVTLDEMNFETYGQVVEFLKSLTRSNIQAHASTAADKAFARAIEHLLNTTVGEQLALPIAKQVLAKVKLPQALEAFEEVIALEKYDNATFVADAKGLLDMGRTAIRGGLYTYFKNRNTRIDFTDEVFGELIRQFTELNILSLYGQEIIEGLGSMAKLDLSAFDNSAVDYKAEQDAYVDAFYELSKLLMLETFPVRTMQEAINVAKGTKKVSWTYFINYTPASLLVSALEELNGTALSGELYKVIFDVLNAKVKVPGGRFLDASALSEDLRKEDYATLMLLAQSSIDFIYNNGVFVRVGKDSSLENVDAAMDVITHIMNINMFDGRYSEILIAAFNKFGIDTSNIDLASINYLDEAEIAKSVAQDVLEALSELGITSFKELQTFAKDYAKDVTKVKDILVKVKNDLVAIDAVHIVEMVEALNESVLFDEVFLPVYAKLIAKFVKGNTMTQVLSLDAYTKEALASDMAVLAQAIRTLYTSEAYKAYTQNMELTDESLALAAEAVRTFGELQILEVKKNDAVLYVDALVKFNLSSVDLTTVNVSHDMNIVAEMVPALYTIMKHSNNFRFSIAMLGDTELMNSMIDVYELFLSTQTSDIVTVKAVRKLLRTIDQTLGINRFADSTDAQIHAVLADSVVALRALSEMGAFSNTGIDFTNKELTDKVFAVISENVRLGKYERYFNAVKNRIHEFGVLPVVYSDLSTRVEINAITKLYSTLMSFLKTYRTKLSMNNLDILATHEFQADFRYLVLKALDSEFIQQVFMPVLVGTSKAATYRFGKIAFCEGMTSDEFVNVALPQIYQLINDLDRLGILNKKFSYKNVDDMATLIDHIVTFDVTKDLCNDLFHIIITKGLKVELTKEELINEAIDYVQEKEYILAALDEIKFEIININISDSNTLLQKDFLIALANAGRCLEHSKLLELVIKDVLVKVVNKVSSVTNVLDFVKEGLNDPAYTAEYAMADYMKLLNVVEQAAHINFFKGELSFEALEGHIDILLNNLFTTHVVKGREERVMRTILDKLTFMDTSTIDLSTVTDWDAEFNAFTTMINEFATLCADPNFNINSITSASFENEDVQAKFIAFVDEASKSYVGRELFKKLFADVVEDKLPADARGLIDLETLPAEKWAEEFEELFDAYIVISKGITTLTVNEILEVYDIIFGLNGRDGIETVKADYRSWLIDMLEKVEVPASNGTTINTDLIPHDNEEARLEVIAFRAIIVELTNYIDPMTQSVSDLDYSAIEGSTNYERLATTLKTLSQSVVTRDILINVIGDAIANNIDESGSSSFKLNTIISDAFWVQYSKSRADYTGYNESFWTDEEFTTFAIFVAVANAMDLGSAGGFDIFNMDLGVLYPSVEDYNNVKHHAPTATQKFPSQEAGANKVGLRQLLQLINASSVFDVTQFGGELGIIARTLINKGLVDDSEYGYRPFGDVDATYEAWNEEIIVLTNALYKTNNLGLLVENGNIAQKMVEITSDQLIDYLTAVNESNILRPILPNVLYKAADLALQSAGFTDAAMRVYAIEQLVPTLAAQHNPSNALASKADYEAIISDVADFIDTAKNDGIIVA